MKMVFVAIFVLPFLCCLRRLLGRYNRSRVRNLRKITATPKCERISNIQRVFFTDGSCLLGYRCFTCSRRCSTSRCKEMALVRDEKS